jgi:glycosyltransferase involved in cell wall biosynthesis
LAVEAVERLRTTHDATLDVYGEGPLRGELLARTASRPWLTVHGARPWRDIMEIQAGADVCLSTSVRDNVQVAALEALARGIPVVSTQVGDAPAYYTHALARFCVPVGDAAALSDALRELADSSGEPRRLFTENGRRLREEHARAAHVLTDLVARAAAAA